MRCFGSGPSRRVGWFRRSVCSPPPLRCFWPSARRVSSFVLGREHSRYRKFLQVQQNKFVLAEVALRFWCRYDNFWMWSVFPIYTKKSNFWALERALIQLWQPRLNTPFIYQFFNCRKGLIPRTKFSGSRQFGTFLLWRKLRWKSTPLQV